MSAAPGARAGPEPALLPEPLAVGTDEEHGGRWTSLRTPGREWLWTNPRVGAGKRAAVRPGEAFVDAGGVEECFPGLRGAPDHGEVWSRPWTGEAPGTASVRAGALLLRRRLTALPDGGVGARYAVEGPPGARVLHAVHALLALSPAARLLVPAGAAVTVLDAPGPGALTRTTWPDGAGVRLDRLGPDDGTARCALVATDRVAVVDGPDRLALRWELLRGAGPLSLVLWRNLGGWPAGAPYRSVGVEPLLGAAVDLATADEQQVGRLDPAGHLGWRVSVRARTARARP
ncbi:hypothetical protein GTQ99_02090 [Kineococcus sp. T13]|uniref:hypothetical protein n=1 Tax=Kineococcus vitellinus TaxID=2696565 RepID=UPI001412F9AD|nr:hypothetical protein [Kineococcus vitellinus]NAZ74219.1 hypothetical protein [Kineococcus vitellinus]